MANYEAPLLYAPVTTVIHTAGALYAQGAAGVSLRRIQVYEIEFGQTGSLSTSTDCQCEWNVSRFGATTGLAATSGTVIPNALDVADSVCAAQYVNQVSAEPTYTTAGFGLQLKSWAINQRGSYRWRALDDGDNIVIPAITVNGIGVRTLSSNFAGSAIGNISFAER